MPTAELPGTGSGKARAKRGTPRIDFPAPRCRQGDDSSPYNLPRSVASYCVATPLKKESKSRVRRGQIRRRCPESKSVRTRRLARAKVSKCGSGRGGGGAGGASGDGKGGSGESGAGSSGADTGGAVAGREVEARTRTAPRRPSPGRWRAAISGWGAPGHLDSVLRRRPWQRDALAARSPRLRLCGLIRRVRDRRGRSDERGPDYWTG